MQANDLKWAELNKALLSAMKINDFGLMQQLYNDMVYIVASEGKDASHLLKERNRCTLLDFKDADIKQVKILTARKFNACDKCYELEGKILSIDEALETMPIPHPQCSKDVFGYGYNFCRCLYISFFEKK